MFWSQNTKWQRAKEKPILSQIQNAKTLKISGTVKMRIGIKRASTFWHRFVAFFSGEKMTSLESFWNYIKDGMTTKD